MGLIKEFREFALKGNMLDLAVGVIIGVAFGGVINSLVNDIIMPPIGKALGNVDFSSLYIPLDEKVGAAKAAAAAATPPQPFGLAEAKKAGPVFAWGNFVTVLVNFLILAFCIFMVVKAFNTARKRFEQQPPPAPAAPPPPTRDQQLLTEIRDLLARR